jgi:hypothetical protein
MRAIGRSPGRPRENRFNSHYYVHCNGWRSDTVIDGVVAGHTDEARSHGFEHAFRYDAARATLRWRGSKRWDPNASTSAASRR